MPKDRDQADLMLNAVAGDHQLGTNVAIGLKNASDEAALLATAPNFDSASHDYAGRVYVVYGTSTGTGSVETAATITVTGHEADTRLRSVEGCDYTGDGWDDLLVGAKFRSSSGANSGSFWTFNGPLTAGDYLTDTPSFTVDGAQGDGMGGHLICGDINDNGRADLLVSADGGSSPTTKAGVVIAYDGTTNTEIARYSGAETGMRFGRDVAMGDFDGDGDQDLAVIAQYTDVPTPSCGSVYLFTTSVLNGDHPHTTATHVIHGDAGDSLDSLSVGPLDTDSFDDIAVGSPNAHAVFLILGSP